jgi:hypothetical protein
MNCKTCGIAQQAGHRFCPGCGELYPDGASNAALRSVAAEVRPLLQEKARLGATLEELVDRAASQRMTPEDRREWEHAYTRWRDLGLEIALAVDHVHPRGAEERRRVERRDQEIPPAEERRAEERRASDDRRDPFWQHAP